MPRPERACKSPAGISSCNVSASSGRAGEGGSGMVETILSLARQLGMAAVAHASAEDFLAGYDDEQPGCIVLDVRMPPGINGVEAGERIRRLDPDVPIVFVTGYSDVSDDDLKQRVPPVSRLHFYRKPLSFTALARDIANIVQRGRGQ